MHLSGGQQVGFITIRQLEEQSTDCLNSQPPNLYRGPTQAYGGPPTSLHPTSVPGPTPGFMNSQPNNVMPPRGNYPPTSMLFLAIAGSQIF